MNIDQMVAEAKERIHRSVGQLARFEKRRIGVMFDRARAEFLLNHQRIGSEATLAGPSREQQERRRAA